MPNSMEQVGTERLRHWETPEPEPEPRYTPEFVRSLVAMFAFASGTFLAAAGLTWWLHPGAGLAIIGLVCIAVGFKLATSD